MMLTESTVAKNHFLFDSPTVSKSGPSRGRLNNKPTTCASTNSNADDDQDRSSADASVVLDLNAVAFKVHLKDGRNITIDGATSYQPEGPLTTFFSSGSTRQALDSWATRLASYRTVDIVSIERAQVAAFRRQPLLVAA